MVGIGSPKPTYCKCARLQRFNLYSIPNPTTSWPSKRHYRQSHVFPCPRLVAPHSEMITPPVVAAIGAHNRALELGRRRGASTTLPPYKRFSRLDVASNI